MITNFLLVALGGALGATLRYAFSLLPINASFPWSTFWVNMLGCFGIGIFITLFKTHKIDNNAYLLLATGICGGFTTFSTFSAESIALLQNNQIITFVLYVIASITLGLLATYLGIQLVK
jgi:fluoride exporter